jgi:hypothetical protein
MVNGHESQDLDTDMDIVDPVEERRTLAERNERLQDQLKVMICLCYIFELEFIIVLFFNFILIL